MEITPQEHVFIDQAIKAGNEYSGAIDSQPEGQWTSSYLWDPSVLTMRGQAGGLKTSLEMLKTLTPDVYDRLPQDIKGEWDNQLSSAVSVLDRINLDQTGEYRTELAGFRDFGNRVATSLQDILATSQAAEGAKTISKPSTSSTQTETAEENSKTMEAGAE